MQQCGEAARTIVHAGTDGDRERLWSVFDGLSDRSRVAEDVLNAFLDRQVERALAALPEPSPPARNGAPLADVAPPRDLDAVGAALVRTASLTVVVPSSLLTGSGRRQPTLKLLAETSRYGSDAVPLPISADLRITSTRMTFPHLQQGRYQVWLERDGNIHTSPIVEVREHPATVTVSERSMADDLAELLPQH
jgi:hypothetical protein